MKFLTVSEASVYLKVSPSLVRRLIKKHKDVLCVSFGQKSTRIIAGRLRDIVNSNTGKIVEIEPLKSKKVKA